MTIATLIYIQNLLEREVATYKNVKELVWRTLCEAEENEADDVETIRREYDNARHKYNAAYGALEDFNSKSWS